MNASFVYESSICFQEKRGLDHAIMEAGYCISEFDEKRDSLMKEIEFYEFFDESSDEYRLMLEEAETSFLGKIGEKIMTIFDKFFKLMKSIGDKFTSLFKKKQDDKRFSEVIENHPELAEAFLENIKKGNVKYSDIKDLDEAISTAEDILKDINNDKVSSQTVGDKVNKAISKLDAKLKPAAGLLGTVGAIAAGATAILGLRNACMKNRVEGVKLTKKIELMKANAEESLKKEMGGEKTTKFNQWCRLQSKICQEEGRRSGFFLDVATKVSEFIDKHSPDAKKSEFKPTRDKSKIKIDLNELNDMDKGTPTPKTQNSTVVKNYYNFRGNRPKPKPNTPKTK